MSTSTLSPSLSSPSFASRVCGSSIEPVTRDRSGVYQADQQVKYLQLQAEMDTLLLELQALKHQREAIMS